MNPKDNKRQSIWISVAAVILLALAGCQSAAPTQAPASIPTTALLPTTAPLPSATSAPTGVPDPVINIASDPKLGKILVDGKGMTLYMFTKDGPDKSTCNTACLKKWPALVTQGHPAAGPGVDASLLGSAPLADGRLIVTYNKQPLYYWYQDAKAGDTLGQDVGNVWYVVDPTGKAVQEAAADTSSSTASSAPADVTVKVASDPKLGKILVDDKGMTLYAFTKDGPNQSTCNTACLKKWPALVTQGRPAAGDGVDASLLGTAPFGDGKLIVTYNKMPLYYWYQDAKTGDTLGQDVGNVWYVVNPAGKTVEEASMDISNSPSADASQEVTIKITSDPKLGKILVDDKGMTLYVYTKDSPNKSSCSAACLEKWPALVTLGHPVAGEGVDASLLGTATLADGKLVVTYNQMPLYHWYLDAKPGDTLGQDAGNVWYVLDPSGKAVEK